MGWVDHIFVIDHVTCWYDSTPQYQMPEEDAFCVFVSLMKDYCLRELYKPSMADLSLCFHLLEKSLEDLLPNLYFHFKAVVS